MYFLWKIQRFSTCVTSSVCNFLFKCHNIFHLWNWLLKSELMSHGGGLPFIWGSPLHSTAQCLRLNASDQWGEVRPCRSKWQYTWSRAENPFILLCIGCVLFWSPLPPYLWSLWCFSSSVFLFVTADFAVAFVCHLPPETWPNSFE